MRLLAGGLGVAMLLALAAVSPRVLPYNMDEFVHYHALGCATAPLGRDLPSFRDGCGLYDLHVPLTETWLPLRSYYYIGSLPAAVFAPFWRLVDDPVAVRIQGAVFFIVVVFLAARLLRVRPAVMVLASLVYPVFAVAFVVDQGPVGLSAVLLFVAFLATRRALAAHRPSLGAMWASLAGFCVFTGLWVKLIFVWWLPAVGLFALAEARSREGGLMARRHRPALVAGALALIVPTLVLLASVDVDGRPYGAAVLRGRVSFEPAQLGAAASRLVPYLTDAALLAPRNVTLPPSILDRVPLVLSMLILGMGLVRRNPRRAGVAGWTMLAILTFALALTSGFTQWPHHFFFPALFLVLALALALDGSGRPTRLIALGLVLVVWAAVALRWPEASHPRDSSPGKDELLSFVRARGLDRQTLQVHSSWGTYYIAQLFGDPRRLAVFVKGIPDDAAQLQQVACLARERNRPLLLISSRRWARLQTDTVSRILGRPEQTWRFGEWWAVVYGTEGVGGCGRGEGA